MPTQDEERDSTEKSVPTMIRLPEDMHKEIKHLAVDEETSMNQWIIARLRQALGRKKRSEEKK